MIVKREFNAVGRNLQEVIERFLVEFYYDFYELDLGVRLKIRNI